MIVNKKYGRVLRNNRRARNLTQKQLAKELDDIAHQQVQKYEAGKNHISLERAAQAAEFLGFDPAEFFGEYIYVDSETNRFADISGLSESQKQAILQLIKEMNHETS